MTAGGVVNAKVASGPQNLSPGLRQAEIGFNLLTYQVKSGFSYGAAPGSSVVPKAGAVETDPLALDGVPKSVPTPYGDALQSSAPEALAARSQVDQGATSYRIGTIGKSQAAEAQFWSLENPANPGYAGRYGIPPENVANADFIETAALRPGASYVTRPAPAVGTNLGGGIEVVTEPNGVTMIYFGTH